VFSGLIHIFDRFRAKFIELGGAYCSWDPLDFDLYLSDAARLGRKTSYVDRLFRYSRIDWLSKQSLCYDQNDYVELSLQLLEMGICYGFNLDDNVYDRSTYVIFSGIPKLFVRMQISALLRITTKL
jgi:hypothetical protein